MNEKRETGHVLQCKECNKIISAGISQRLISKWLKNPIWADWQF
jgi:hypothetical protein